MKFYRRYIVQWLSYIAMLHDLLVASLIWYFAFLLRFNFDIPANFIGTFWQTLPFVIATEFGCFLFFGLYRGLWRFASIPDLKRIIRATALSALMIGFASLIVQPQLIIPRSVLILNPLLLVLTLGGSRFAYRAWKERRLFNPIVHQGKPVIVLGVEEAAISLIKELAKSHEWRVVALLDDNILMHGREFMHIRVEGPIAALADVAEKYSCMHCIIAMPSANHITRSHAINTATSYAMEVLTLPLMSDLISGKVSISQIRKVDVEDLLGRDAVKLDNTGLQHLIEDHAVLVSGAGGSIGSELCRQILKYKPSTLVCLDISEYALYNLEQEFSRQKFTSQIVYMTGDVKNSHRVNDLLVQHKPSVVFHAAAYKHVPLMENGNVCEALLNNVLGTYTLAQACKDHNVDKFVLISTDKAVNPTNVMGASKRLAEMVCQGLQDTQPSAAETNTRFVIVRFGNVLGSSGSVIPKFREQIAKGGPITITHPEITRYFMSIPEAAQLVMQAGLMGNGGEIFVLDMGEPVKIATLAADMIRLSGLQLEDVKIEYIGLRPGEKLYEELLADDEQTMPTPHEKLRIALARPVDKVWVKKLLKWINQSQGANEAMIKNELKLWVEEYSPQQSSLMIHAEMTNEQNTLH